MGKRTIFDGTVSITKANIDWYICSGTSNCGEDDRRIHYKTCQLLHSLYDTRQDGWDGRVTAGLDYTTKTAGKVGTSDGAKARMNECRATGANTEQKLNTNKRGSGSSTSKRKQPLSSIEETSNEDNEADFKCLFCVYSLCLLIPIPLLFLPQLSDNARNIPEWDLPKLNANVR